MTKNKAGLLNRKQIPKITDAVNLHLELKPYEKFILKNGVEVYSINAGAEDVMMIEWVFNAGNWFEDDNLQAATANFLLKNGTSTKTAFQVNEHFEYYGAYLNRNCYAETANLSLHCLNRHLSELLPVVREILTDSVFPEEEIATYKQNMQQRLDVSLKKCDFVAGRLIDSYLFGENHPYGRFSKYEYYEALQRERLLQFYKKYYQHGKFIIFMAGKIPANAEDLLNQYFGDLPITAYKHSAIALEPVAEKKYRVINDPNGVQGAIRIARHFPNRHHKDFPKVQVLNNIFGGFFGSRLMNNIREDKGYTYGIYSYLMNQVFESGWIISTEAGKDVCEATVGEVYKEMEILRNEKVDEEELMLVRNYMMGSILGDLDGPFQILNRWKTIILNGLDENYFNNSLEIIRTISAGELQQLAQKYLDPESFYELVVV
ncbi:MAG: insulinase family protein [Chitinophagaceae bacterium]|nr:insulinase family protein [Chitinophagaceae bacterium]